MEGSRPIEAARKEALPEEPSVRPDPSTQVAPVGATLAQDDRTESKGAPPLVKVAASPTRCPFCHDDIPLDRDDWVVCKSCLARHHAACWREGKVCSTCGGKSCLRAGAGTALGQPRRTTYSVLTNHRRLPGEDVGQGPPRALATLSGVVTYLACMSGNLWALAILAPLWLLFLVHSIRLKRKHDALLREILERHRHHSTTRSDTSRSTQGN